MIKSTLVATDDPSNVYLSADVQVVMDLFNKTAKYIFPKRFKSPNLEEALMSVPNLETVQFTVLKRTEQYKIQQVESGDGDKWKMSFVMLSKYGDDLPSPKHLSVRIQEVPN